MRAGLTVVGLGLGIAFAAPARAQTPCPPDGWFCDDGQPAPEESPAGDTADPPAPDAEAGEWSTPPAKPQKAPIVVYRPEEELAPSEQGSLIERHQVQPRAWGVNLRLEGMLMAHETRYEDAGMGGLGVSLRYQPLPLVALDLGLDVLGGNDYNGFERTELMWSLSGLFFFNPQMPLKVYALAGVNMSFADVEVIYFDGVHDDQSWNYFGGQLGIGLQAELSPRLALNFDLVGFLRGRTDSLARSEPEFIDSHGRMTNNSGGGLLRGGLTFFW
jgi:hypothetical protein